MGFGSGKDISKTVKSRPHPARLRKKVRRCLFGPVNHAEIEASLKHDSDLLDRRSNSKWNFDFGKEAPLSGDYVWEKIEADNVENVPKAYEMKGLFVAGESRKRCPDSRSNAYSCVVPKPSRKRLREQDLNRIPLVSGQNNSCSKSRQSQDICAKDSAVVQPTKRRNILSDVMRSPVSVRRHLRVSDYYPQKKSRELVKGRLTSA